MAPLPRVIIFSRLPVPGQVMTRLIPALGWEGAAVLQNRLAQALAARLWAQARLTPFDLELCYTGGNQAAARSWLGEGLLYAEQGEGDLGTRMERALHRALASGAPRVVLVGSDLPGLGGETVDMALAGLQRLPLALGPSTDGGYYLIGLSRPVPGLLDPPHWETLAGVRSRAMKMGLEPFLTPKMRDLDTPEDLAYWQKQAPELFAGRPAK